MIINGVKGNCTLNNLKYFNSVDSTCIDYMHSVLEGVIKNLFNYWFNGKISASYSLGKYMQELDRRLLNIFQAHLVQYIHIIYGVLTNTQLLFYFIL